MGGVVPTAGAGRGVRFPPEQALASSTGSRGRGGPQPRCEGRKLHPLDTQIPVQKNGTSMTAGNTKASVVIRTPWARAATVSAAMVIGVEVEPRSSS